jgi:hypothetical protein
MIEILFISILERPVAFAVRHAYAAKRHGGLRTLSSFSLPKCPQITCTMNKSDNIYNLLCYLIDETITPHKKLADTRIIEFGNCTASLR